MEPKQTSEPQNPHSKPTGPGAKPAESEPIGSFEELLELDPRQVEWIEVLPAAEPGHGRAQREIDAEEEKLGRIGA